MEYTVPLSRCMRTETGGAAYPLGFYIHEDLHILKPFSTLLSSTWVVPPSTCACADTGATIRRRASTVGKAEGPYTRGLGRARGEGEGESRFGAAKIDRVVARAVPIIFIMMMIRPDQARDCV